MRFLRHALWYNITFFEAASAEHALQLFADHGRRVDLLLRRRDFADKFGAAGGLLPSVWKLPDLPVILASGHPVSSWNARDSIDLHRLGKKSVKIIQKPFQARPLSSLVNPLLGISPPGADAQCGIRKLAPPICGFGDILFRLKRCWEGTCGVSIQIWAASLNRRNAFRAMAGFLAGSPLLHSQQDPFRDHSLRTRVE